jgi:putative nucleotidyltransferase with HDIG domain
MALAIRYAISRRYNKTKTKLLGLCALLHDIGKTKTNEDILTAPRKLSDEDFAKIKSHPIQGYNLARRLVRRSLNEFRSISKDGMCGGVVTLFA